MRIDRDSYGTIAKVWLIALILIVLLLWLVDLKAVSYGISALLVIFMAFVTCFHRVPVR